MSQYQHVQQCANNSEIELKGKPTHIQAAFDQAARANAEATILEEDYALGAGIHEVRLAHKPSAYQATSKKFVSYKEATFVGDPTNISSAFDQAARRSAGSELANQSYGGGTGTWEVQLAPSGWECIEGGLETP